MTFNILVVCTGNICRSPMGEIVLRAKLQQREALQESAGLNRGDIRIASAAVTREEQGNGLDSRAAQVLKEAGYPLPARHRAHKATREELLESDLIVAMTAAHARALQTMVEQAGGDTSRIHLWREFDGTLPYVPEGVFGAGGALAPDFPDAEGSEAYAQINQSVSVGISAAAESDSYDPYGSGGILDVPDPWFGGIDGFYRTLSVIEKGADGVLDSLAATFREAKDS